MEKYKWLEKVAKYHNDWIKIVNSFGEYNFAEDIVQLSYIALMRYASENKVIKNGKVKPNGSTYKRLLELKAMYVNSTK